MEAWPCAKGLYFNGQAYCLPAEIADGQFLCFISGELVGATPAGQGGAAWGGITGTLSSQTDLQTALDAKASSNHNHDSAYAAAAHNHDAAYEAKNSNIQAHVASQHAPATAEPRSATSALGYATGAGGTVTQATSKSTGVTLNKLSGRITTHNAALAAGAEVTFVVTNNTVAATDVPVLALQSGGPAGSYDAVVSAVGAGSFSVTLTNLSAGSLSQAVAINFVVLKGATA